MTTPTRESISKVVDAWFQEHVHGSDIGRDTPAWNHLVARLPMLKASLEFAFAPVREVTQSERDSASGSSVGAKKP